MKFVRSGRPVWRMVGHAGDNRGPRRFPTVQSRCHGQSRPRLVQAGSPGPGSGRRFSQRRTSRMGLLRRAAVGRKGREGVASPPRTGGVGHVVARLLVELPDSTPAPRGLVGRGRVLDNFYIPSRHPNSHPEGGSVRALQNKYRWVFRMSIGSAPSGRPWPPIGARSSTDPLFRPRCAPRIQTEALTAAPAAG